MGNFARIINRFRKTGNFKEKHDEPVQKHGKISRWTYYKDFELKSLYGKLHKNGWQIW